jgi:hypothetical protein
MSDHIYDTNNDFNFDKLVLLNPIVTSGGNYFIKYSMNEYPLYIQPPKCIIKNGFLKTGKRYYCDLIFSIENEKFIQWVENLETYSHRFIHKNREKWFETELELHDIENYFTSPLKSFKSGKNYIVRVYTPASLGKTEFKIYDDDENIVDITTVKDNTNALTVLEIKGIKCSAKSFIIEIELKQMMILKPIEIFDRCVFKTKTEKSEIKENSLAIEEQQTIDTISIDTDKNLKSILLENQIDENITISNEPIQESESVSTEVLAIRQEEIEDKIDNFNDDVENKQLLTQSEPEIINDNELQEVVFNLEEVSQDSTFIIKKRNDVYYDMYNEALRKARLAKEMAITNYLEAKRIKNTYMLNDLDDSDLEEDFNYEDVEK